MTIQRSICKLIDISYLKNILRRTWSYGFICFIITFACMPIPLLMEANSLWARYNYNNSIKIENLLIETVSEGLNYLWIFIFASFAIIGGVMTFDYIINRKKAYLYHSFPERRSTHYVCNVLATSIWFFAAVVANVIITTVVFAANEVLTGAVMSAYIGSVLQAVVYFILAFAITALCASLTGQMVSTLAGIVVVCFLPICIYFAFANIIYYNADYSSLYEVSELFIYITPLIRLILSSSDMPFTTLELILTVLASVGIFVGAYFIDRYRKIESAGTPVIHAPFGETVKYLILFPLTFFAGMLFEAFGGGVVWLFFGFFFGALVGLVFINLFLYRNPSKMFFGIKGFCIFLAAFLAFFIIFGFNVFHHDRYVPNEKHVSSVTLSLHNDEFSFSDDETVEMLVDYAEDMIDEDISEPINYSNHYGWIEMRVRSKLGVTYQKRIPICDINRTNELYSALQKTDEYLEIHKQNVKTMLASNRTSWMSIPIIGYLEYSFSIASSKLAEAYLLDLENPDRYSSRYICSVYGGSYTMVLYSADKNSMNLIADYIGYASGEEMLSAIDEFARECISGVKVSVDLNYIDEYYEKTQASQDGYWNNQYLYSKSYTGDEAYEIYLSLFSRAHGYDEYTFPNTVCEYDVTVYYEMTEELYEKYKTEYAPKNSFAEISYPSYNKDGLYEFSTVFRADSVPPFVEEYFSSPIK